MSHSTDSVHDPFCPEAHRPDAHLPVSRSRLDSWDRAIARVDACIGRAEALLVDLAGRGTPAMSLVPLLSGLTTAIVAALVLVVMAGVGASSITAFLVLVVVAAVAAAVASSGFGRMAGGIGGSPLVEQVRETLAHHLALRRRLVAGRQALSRALDPPAVASVREW